MTPSESPIRVLIADDDAIVRSALRTHLSTSRDIEVIGEAQNGQEAVEVIDSGIEIDVVLMDVRMPVQDGLSAASEISARGHTRPRVLLVTSFDTDDIVVEALRARCNGLVLKSAGAEAMVDAVRAVHRGTTVFSEGPISRLADVQQTTPPSDLNLTPREADTLELLCKAMSNAEIAKTLHLSESRVKAHVSSVMARLGVDSRLRVVVRAFELGLVTLDRPDPATLPQER